MMHADPTVQPTSAVWRNYVELCKPRVVLLMLLTVVVGMYLAAPGWVNLFLLSTSLLGIGLCAGSAAAINHLVDKRIDSIMARTKKRPVASGQVSVRQALWFALIMGTIGLTVLVVFVNGLTALLTFMTLIGYAGIYTGYLKRATPQNIVIGGLAGAAPPLLGWTAVTNHLDPQALLLVLIIFIWTPPHFWALAIYRYEEYQHAQIPMLPVTHGIQFTKLNIYLYTILLVVVSVLPFVIGMSGLFYLIGALVLGARFLFWAHQLYHTDKSVVAMQTFRFSIIYLMLLFVFLLIDHYL
ncbi:polyprenyltransferase (cytochrome oxidase assembly factor) [Legionella gratiana]|uniref:Protoheme IX farnesyltransferase n=2 Tax=Legionella gratiana TaxID=45066 RepID=A0A378J537_9GAMM|nr:polyprenyltransferase (cytochrome oxidase assembly factor) [Legionella gratiana]STX42378.1 polyprenyltransferase (cytochrome oxidase assembly factor) [Legionella gratiana]